MKHFVSREEFDRLLGEGFFIEHAEIAGNLYGTSRKELLDLLAASPAIADLDIRGAEQLRETLPKEALMTIFLRPSSLEELVARLDARGPMSPEERSLRLARIQHELDAAPSYDHVVTNANGKLEETVEVVCDLIGKRLASGSSAA